ncbi:MAG: hydroxypyruvate isomerase, partial [Opitutaceae bacterium]
MPNPAITRRSALQGIAGAATLASLARPAFAADPAKPAGAIRHSVCKWCYKDIPLEAFCAAVK